MWLIIAKTTRPVSLHDETVARPLSGPGWHKSVLSSALPAPLPPHTLFLFLICVQYNNGYSRLTGDPFLLKHIPAMEEELPSTVLLMKIALSVQKKELSMLTALTLTPARGRRTHFPQARGEPRHPAGGPCEPSHCHHWLSLVHRAKAPLFPKLWLLSEIRWVQVQTRPQVGGSWLALPCCVSSELPTTALCL